MYFNLVSFPYHHLLNSYFLPAFGFHPTQFYIFGDFNEVLCVILQDFIAELQFHHSHISWCLVQHLWIEANSQYFCLALISSFILRTCVTVICWMRTCVTVICWMRTCVTVICWIRTYCNLCLSVFNQL